MKIIIVGGFLGSGKTTLLRLLLEGMDLADNQVAVIENEIGTIGIDNLVLGQTEISVTPLFGGCVCCSISGQLTAALAQIETNLCPDWVVVEMTGLALMDTIRDTLHIFRSNWEITTVSVVDMSRWKHLTGALVYIFQHQITGADHLLLNKTDICEPNHTHIQTLQGYAPHGKITVLNAEKKSPARLYQLLCGEVGEL